MKKYILFTSIFGVFVGLLFIISNVLTNVPKIEAADNGSVQYCTSNANDFRKCCRLTGTSTGGTPCSNPGMSCGGINEMCSTTGSSSGSNPTISEFFTIGMKDAFLVGGGTRPQVEAINKMYLACQQLVAAKSGAPAPVVAAPAPEFSLAKPAGTFLTLRLNSAGTGVAELQKYLLAAGYDIGFADGRFGLKTQAALKLWQRSVGIEDDGVFGPVALARAMIAPQNSIPNPNGWLGACEAPYPYVCGWQGLWCCANLPGGPSMPSATF